MTSPNPSPTAFTVACIQTEPVFGDVDANLEYQRAEIERVAVADVRLVVLPECSTTGYCFESRSEADAVAEDVTAGTGPAMTVWCELARRWSLHIVGGVVERNEGELFNSAVLIGPSGPIGTYRKAHLWHPERDNFAAGNLGFPVYDTPLGRIAMQICYDGWFPEGIRVEALQGADLICMPSNWVPVPDQDPTVPPMANMLCMTAAHTNLVYVAAASRVGTERGQPFIGASIIVDHTGNSLAGPASMSEPATIIAQIDPIGSRPTRRGNPFNQPLHDRRLDLYAETLGSAHVAGPY